MIENINFIIANSSVEDEIFFVDLNLYLCIRPSGRNTSFGAIFQIESRDGVLSTYRCFGILKLFIKRLRQNHSFYTKANIDYRDICRYQVPSIY